MADEKTGKDLVAESPPAIASEPPKDSAAYQEWRKTGKLPEAPKAEKAAEPPKKEGSGPPKKSESGEKPDEKGAPASEAGKEKEPESKPRSNAESRLREILDDLRTAGFTPAELKTYRREPPPPPKGAPEKTEKPKAAEPPKKPKLEDFSGDDAWTKFEEARDKYYDDLADYKAAKAIEDYHARQEQERGERELAQRLHTARERYGETAENTIRDTATAIFRDEKIPPGVKAMIESSPVLIDLLYVMGSKADDFRDFLEIAHSNPALAVRRAVLVEHLVTEELKKLKAKPDPEQARDGAGLFAGAKVPEKKVSEAPPPPKEVGGSAGPPPDELAEAFTAGDFSRFRAAANRRDQAQRQGR